MNNTTQRLAEFIAESKYEDLPEAVVHEARRVFLDSVGCALAGMETDKGRISVELVRRSGGAPEASVIGAGIHTSCANAAFANGELFSALDFEAMLVPATHVAPFVMPAALAIGESRRASGKDLILSMVLGHELTSRVASGLSSGRGVLKEGPDGRMQVFRPPAHGYSANAFGSVAGAGKMLRLDARKMANALGIAGYNAPMQVGAQWHHSGTACLVKWGSAGWTAQEGATAALLAEIGYTGDTDVLDGEYGFWRFAGSLEWKPEAVVKDLGKSWYIVDTEYKFFPCCGLTTGPLGCFDSILETHKLLPEEIQEIKVWMHPNSQMPIWRNRIIENEVQAQYSVAYAFAVAAHRIPRGFEWQTAAAMKNPGFRGFMDKVTVAVHQDYQNGKAGSSMPVRVDVVARGQTFSEERSAPRGKDARPSDSALVDKFQHNALPVLGPRRTAELIEALWALEKAPDLSRFSGLWRRP